MIFQGMFSWPAVRGGLPLNRLACTSYCSCVSIGVGRNLTRPCLHECRQSDYCQPLVSAHEWPISEPQIQLQSHHKALCGSLLGGLSQQNGAQILDLFLLPDPFLEVLSGEFAQLGTAAGMSFV